LGVLTMVEIAWCEWFPVPKALCRQPDELTFPVGKYMSVQEAMHRLKANPQAKAAAELLKPMRSGALPTAILCVRLRDGAPLSSVVTQFPVPACWDTASPEILGKDGAWTIPDGDAFVACYAQVDIQCFNELFPGGEVSPQDVA
jgi:hypothetical protein